MLRSAWDIRVEEKRNATIHFSEYYGVTGQDFEPKARARVPKRKHFYAAGVPEALAA